MSLILFLNSALFFFSQDMGYTPDFIAHCIKPLVHDIKEKGDHAHNSFINHTHQLIFPTGIRVVTNAGGINPQGCVNAIKEVMRSEGVELSVAMVTGDDMMKSVSAYGSWE